MKKVSILVLILAISLDTTLAFARPKKQKARAAAVKRSKKVTTTTEVQEVAPVVDTTPVVEAIPVVTAVEQVEPAPVQPQIINNTTNDLDAIKLAIREELQANNELLKNANEIQKDTKENEEIAKAKSDLATKIEETRMACSDIKHNLDTIFGLSVATTVSSGLGTVAAGSALAVGIVKSVKDKKIEEKKAQLSFLTSKTDNLSEDPEELREQLGQILPELDDEYSRLKKEIEEDTKKSKVLGNIRTGLMAGATTTSLVSTGTSIGASVTAAKLAEKMSSCNAKLSELKIAKNTLIAVLEDAEQPSTIATADNILNACTGYDEANIKTLKTTMTASAVVSGIGSAVAGAGTVTSIMANTDKTRNNDSEKGKKKEKTLNLISNIAAGVTTGTSATSTVLSATAISRAKKDSEMAERCESALAQ